jgi:hypothetical protein
MWPLPIVFASWLPGERAFSAGCTLFVAAAFACWFARKRALTARRACILTTIVATGEWFFLATSTNAFLTKTFCSAAWLCRTAAIVFPAGRMTIRLFESRLLEWLAVITLFAFRPPAGTKCALSTGTATLRPVSALAGTGLAFLVARRGCGTALFLFATRRNFFFRRITPRINFSSTVCAISGRAGSVGFGRAWNAGAWRPIGLFHQCGKGGQFRLRGRRRPCALFRGGLVTT